MDKSETHRTPVVLIVGPPGSGKGDRSRDAAHNFDGWRFSTGDYFRDQAALSANDTGVMHAGGLVDTQTFEAAIDHALAQAEPGKLLILDGVAKKAGEAKLLLNALERMAFEVALVIFLDTPESVGRKRCAGRDASRTDDGDDKQDRRWTEYRVDTRREIDFLFNNCPGIVINGDGTPEKIQAQIDEAISEALERIC